MCIRDRSKIDKSYHRREKSKKLCVTSRECLCVYTNSLPTLDLFTAQIGRKELIYYYIVTCTIALRCINFISLRYAHTHTHTHARANPVTNFSVYDWPVC